MEVLRISLTALASIITLFILTKIMGNRQMSQLSMFDYINGITIGSIAAEMATSLEDDYLKPLTAMIVYALMAVLISFVTCKSMKLRRLLVGKPLVLYEDGKLYKKNLKKVYYDVNEFLTQCRIDGYFNLADIQTAVLETNGKISFLPVSQKRPVTPEDLNLTPKQEKPVINVILDGHIMHQNLKYTGNNEKWLQNQLHEQGISNIKEVFLATCDSDNNLSIYVELSKAMKRDTFQ